MKTMKMRKLAAAANDEGHVTPVDDPERARAEQELQQLEFVASVLAYARGTLGSPRPRRLGRGRAR